MKIGLQKYYKILRDFQIIDGDNYLQPPYDSEDMFRLEYQDIKSPWTGRTKKFIQRFSVMTVESIT